MPSIDDIYGWFDFKEAYDIIIEKSKSTDTIVEVGCLCGKSTAYMANKIRDSGKNIKFFAVDTFKGASEEQSMEWHDVEIRNIISRLNPTGTLLCNFTNNLHNFNLLKYVNPLCIDSSIAARIFDSKSIFAVYIDASHKHEMVMKDIKAWLPKIKDGGIISGHDIDMTEVKTAVEKFFGEDYTVVGRSWIKYV